MKIVRILTCLMLMCTVASAQVDSVYNGLPPEKEMRKKKVPRERKWLEKMTYGGNFQAWLGNPTFLYLSPTVGYSPIEKLNFGLGFVYNYTSVRYYNTKYTQSIYGGHSYVRYLVTDGVFVQLQYDKLLQPDFFATDPSTRVWVDYVLAGIGFRQPLGDKAAFSSTIMYNLTPSPLSIYYPTRVVIQFGFTGSF